MSYPYAQHEAADRKTSAAFIDAIETALDDTPWVVEWVMTGGGCSAFGLYDVRTALDAGGYDGPWFLLTGLDDSTEATADLTRGIVIGFYANDESEGDAYQDIPSMLTPSDAAQRVVEFVALVADLGAGV